ncbi:MAG: PAS domain S-box protein [Bacteroidota bacterium]
MKTTTKLYLILIVLVGGFITLLVILGLSKQYSHNLLHESIEKNDDMLFSHILQLNEEKINNPLMDNSTWDATIKYIENPRRAFEKECLNTLLSTFSINHIWVFGLRGEKIYYVNDTTSRDIGDCFSPEDILNFLTVQHPQCHFFYQKANRLFEIFGSTVTSTFDVNHKENPRGYLLFAKTWDSAFVEKLSAFSGSKISVETPENSSLMEERHGSTIHYYNLKDFRGVPLGRIKVENEIYFQSKWDNEFFLTIILSVFIGILSIIIIGFLLRAWISKPLTAMIQALDEGTEAPVIPMVNKSGEFGKIAKLIISTFKLKDEIRVSEEKFRLLSENMIDVIWTMDLTGRLIYVSPSVLPLLGFTPGELMALTFDEMFTTDSAGIVNRTFTQISELVRSGEPIENQRKILEHNCRDGSKKWVEISIQGVYDKEHQFMFILGVTRDVTERKLIQEDLRLSENRFRQIAESSSDFIWDTDINGLFTYCSDKVEDILGYSSEEVVGKKHFYDFFSPGILEEYKASAFTIFERKEPFRNFVNPNIHKNGKTVILETSASPVFNEKGEMVGYRGTDKDITIGHNALLALESNEKTLSAITSSVRDGIVMFDSGGSVSFWNNSATAILGYTKEEITGKNFRDMIVPLGFMQQYRTALTGLFETGNENENGNTLELPAIHKNRQEIPVELLLSSVKLNENWFAVGVLRDISERKNTERILRESEEKYKTVFNTSPDAVTLTKSDGTYIDANEGFEKISGYSKEDVVGRSANEIKIWVQDECRRTIADLLSENEMIDNLESELLCKNGTTLPVVISGSKILVNDEDYILLITRDISQRRKFERDLREAKEKAEESSRLKSSLLMNMSHELRTPLNGILGFAGLLGNDLTDPEQISMAEVITTSGNRLMTTLNSIMDLAQIEANQTIVRLADMDIGEIAREFVKHNRPGFERKRIQFIDNINTGVWARIDERLFINIVFHLLDNSVKYTEEGFISLTVKTETRNNNSFAILKVTDTGIGISDEQLGFIFDAFRQGKEGLGRSHEGAGLGLTLCLKFTSLMDGKIEVESKIGIGSTFTVFFPQPPGEPNARETPSPRFEELIRALGSEKPRVLIVEDNETNSDLMAIYLKDNFITDVAYSGIQAAKMAYLNNYDLILMDINLGQGMDGIETSREIKKIDRYLAVPVIAVTGYSSDIEKQKIMSQGFDDFLLKPFDKAGLISVIIKTLKIIPAR